MKLYQKFCLLSRGKQIGIVVSSLHLLLVFSLLIHHVATRRLKPPRPMIVRTLAAPPPPKAIAQSKPAKAAPKKAVAKESKPKTAAPAKKLAPPKIVKAAPPIKEERIIKEITEKIERPRPTLSIPSKIEPKADTPIAESTNDATYSEYLIAHLQTSLDLPEYGEVRAKIEIDRFGKLIDCIILEAKSSKNAEFLKNQLPALTFSCLNDFGIIESTQTFTITFRNVEIR